MFALCSGNAFFGHLNCLSVAGHNASLDLKGKTQINMQLHFV